MSVAQAVPHEHRVLVVCNVRGAGDRLRRTLEARARNGPVEAVVVAPALNSRLRHWTSDEDGARAAAADRLRRCLGRLEATPGALVRGEVGDADPEQAIADTLARFPADEIVIATEPPGRSHRLARDLVQRTADRFALPVTPIEVHEPRPPVPLGAAARRPVASAA